MKRAISIGLLVWFVAAFTGCPGLPLDRGNAFPCDYNQPETERDAACPEEWVCSVNGVCQRYTYEGPQFEGVAPLPTFDTNQQTEPRVINRPVIALGKSVRAIDKSVVLTGTGDGGTTLHAVDVFGVAKPAPINEPIRRVALIQNDEVAVQLEKGEAWVLRGDAPLPVRFIDGGVVDAVAAMRVQAERDGGVAFTLLRKKGNQFFAGDVVDGATPFEYQPLNPNGTMTFEALDVRRVRRSALLVLGQSDVNDTLPIAFTSQGIWSNIDGNWVRLNADDEFTPKGNLIAKHDVTASVWAVAYSMGGKRARALNLANHAS